MVEIKHVTKTYGHTEAVSGISFCLEPGTLTGFLGPNGAGKTTTINMITGILGPTAGEIFYNGKNIFDDLPAWKMKSGVVCEQPLLFHKLTLWICCSFLVSHKLVSLPGTGPGKKLLSGILPGLQRMGNRPSLFLKELLSLLHTIDVKMSACIVLIFIIYLILTPLINQALFGLITAVIVILHASFFFNSFGLDHQALDRYLLFPVSSSKVITAKNKAALIILGIQVFPLLLINLFKSQAILLISYYSLIIMDIMLVYCLAGNITSILLARPRKYSHFGETGDSGSGRTFFAALCWGIPFYVNNVLEGNIVTGIFIYAGFLIVLLCAFFVLRRKTGILFEERKEEMRENLL
ncbi:MAG: ATP-binding cassette domain-containing protein [Spirochaetales bacterium]|nr:ATP-binding cassette domain-containing protein [Spirochaetales bacterium]